MSNSLPPHGLQHIRLSCPSLSPRDCSNSCPSSWWCHPTVSSSVARFSSYPQSFAGSGSFPVSQLFTSGDQSTGASASASVLPVNTESWFLLVLTDLISLLSKGLSESSPAPRFESINSYGSVLTSIHDYCKIITLTVQNFVGKVISLPFNILSRFVIVFLPRSNHLLISWVHSPSAVILEPKKYKVSHCFHCFSIYLQWSDGTKFHDLSFLSVEF